MKFVQQFSFKKQSLPEKYGEYTITKYQNDKAAIYKKNLFNYLVLTIKQPVWYGSDLKGYYRDAGWIGGAYCYLFGSACRIFNTYSK